MKNLSLKWRFTFLAALISTIICILMSYIAVTTVQNQFVDDFIYDYDVEIRDDIIIHAWNYDSVQNTQLDDVLKQASTDFTQKMIIITIIVIILGSTTMYLISSIFLKPIKKLNLNIKEFNINELTKRISHSSSKDELNDLSISFNEMMDRIEKGFLREKRFSANIAHELKTPLTTMKANLDIYEIANETLTENEKELLTILKYQNTRMIELVTNLLSFSSVDSIIVDEKFYLDDVIDEVIIELQNEIKEKNIDLTSDVLHISINGNEVLLKNAISNIVSNAIKYNKDNGTIKIYCDENKLLHIKDSGIGIEAKYQTKIFEPLFRINESRSREIAGAGIGLALVYEIIKKHNGDIIVKSDGKTYSDFIINLTVSN